jgi:hypothetical protein
MEQTVRLVMAQEAAVLEPILKDYYEDIGFKEATENVPVMLNQIAQACANNFVFVVFDEKEDITYPLDLTKKPVAFLWFKMDLDMFGRMYCHTEAAYITKAYRKTGLFKKLMDLLSLHSRWYRVNYYTVDASTRLLHKAWGMMGFKDEHIHMVFRGGPNEFHAKGQNFQWFDEEKEVVHGKQVKKQTDKHKRSKSTSTRRGKQR